MVVTYTHEGQEILPGRPFEANGVAYPGNWLAIASADDLAGAGITRTEAPDPEPPPPPDPPSLPPMLAFKGLVRFGATAPIDVKENIGLGPVARISKGRYRVTFETAMQNDSYSVMSAVKDVTVRVVRATARTANYVEVRVTDLSGAAQDAEEVTVRVERVI